MHDFSRFACAFIFTWLLLDWIAAMAKKKTKVTLTVTPYPCTPPRVYSKLMKNEQCQYCDRRGVLIVCDRADFQGGVYVYCASANTREELVLVAHSVISNARRNKVTLLMGGQ